MLEDGDAVQKESNRLEKWADNPPAVQQGKHRVWDGLTPYNSPGWGLHAAGMGMWFQWAMRTRSQLCTLRQGRQTKSWAAQARAQLDLC